MVGRGVGLLRTVFLARTGLSPPKSSGIASVIASPAFFAAPGPSVVLRVLSGVVKMLLYRVPLTVAWETKRRIEHLTGGALA